MSYGKRIEGSGNIEERGSELMVSDTLQEAREEGVTLTSKRINCTAYQWQSLIIPADRIRWDEHSRPEDTQDNDGDEDE